MSKFKPALRTYVRRLKRAGSALFGAEGGALKIERHGDFDVAFRRGTTDERVIAHSFANDIFLSAVPDYTPAPDDVIMDIGAHIGTFALLAARMTPRGHVWAIEASRDTFNYLRINAAINGLAHLEVSHLALSDKTGHTRLFHDTAGSWGHSIMTPLSSQGEEVATRSLAEYMSERGIDRVHFAKLNCEGAEFPILLGASRAVLERFERMLILFHCDLAPRYHLEGLTRHLEACGFDLDIKANKKSRGRIIAHRRSGA